MAGHALTSTSGGFLTYFFYEFAPSAFAVALLMTLPDVAGLAGMLTRKLSEVCGGRKRVWLGASLLARVASALVPLSLFWHHGPLETYPQLFILVCVGIWHVFQAVSFLAYLSWIAALLPDSRWGHFNASRTVAGVVVTLILPTAVACWREYAIQGASPEWRLGTYSLVFIAGTLLSLLSILPLLWLPDPDANTTTAPVASHARSIPRVGLLDVLRDAQFRCLLAQWWWLSLFQGLTQAVLWKFRISVLQISLPIYLVMNSVMLLLQIPLGIWMGKLCDGNRHWLPYVISIVVLSFSMLLYAAATPATWWLVFIAHGLFGLFGLINVGLDTASLKLAPQHDNLMHLAVFRQAGSLLAGIAGLLGGLWLDHFVSQGATKAAGLDVGCRVLLIVSWIGRLTAAAWLLPYLLNPPLTQGRDSRANAFSVEGTAQR